MSKLRDLLHELANTVADHLERTGPEYYDQETSPLPPATHCRMVRTGRIPGFKVAGRVLVKRSDMHNLIDAHRVEPHVTPTSEDDAEIADALSRIGMRKAG